jgi:septal ring factor EnvC (AmiA/AmiB activator)
VAYLQNENSSWQHKIGQLEQTYEKEKEELSWMLNKQEINNKNLSSELRKLSDELQLLNNLYKETEKELNELKRKPVHEAERKRRRYEITREFVQQLES